MPRPSQIEGRLKSRRVKPVETRQRLVRQVSMDGDPRNPCTRFAYCGYRILPVKVQQKYEGESDG